MNRHLLYILILLLFSPIIASAQKARFTFETDLCACSAIFDSTKYSRTQLQNTLDLLYNAPYIQTDAVNLRPQENCLQNIGKLAIECEQRLQELHGIDFVRNPFWEQVRLNRVHEIENTCELRRITLLAWINPDTLLSYKDVDSICIFYRDALIAGGGEMLEAWAVLNEKMKEQNGSPERLQQHYEEKLASADRLIYAREEIMAYGWWNAANHLIYHMPDENLYAEFEKLFLKVKCECDEP
jgi:hypothetical protein